MSNPYLDTSLLSVPELDDPLSAARASAGLMAMSGMPPMRAMMDGGKKTPKPIVTRFPGMKTGIRSFACYNREFEQNPIDFTGSTLILSTVSTGNVAQMAMDHILTELANKTSKKGVSSTSGIRKIGYIRDRNILPAICNEPFSSNSRKKKRKSTKTLGQLSMPIELFWIESRRICLFQQRTKLRLGGRVEFMKNLSAWLEQCNFGNIGVLTSDSITRRSESQITDGCPFVYYSYFDDSLKKDTMLSEEKKSSKSVSMKNLIDKASELGWMKSEKEDITSKYSAKPVSSLLIIEEDDTKDESKADESNDNSVNIVGGGLTKLLFDQCKEMDQPVIVLCQFVYEGDNSADSLDLLNRAKSLFF